MRFPGPLVGVVHLLPLPGSPRYGGRLDTVVARAVRDARAYEQGGADAVIVENYGDAPFEKDALPPEVVASFARCAVAVREAIRLPLGVNALRNDARAALAIAHASAASFVRVNVLAGVVATDQGLVEGRAAEVARVRAALDRGIAILADVRVKHGTPLHETDLAEAARDLHARAGADAIIVTGVATGAPTAVEDLEMVRQALPARVPVLAGSGVNHRNAAETLRHATAVIVGTSLERGGTGGPVDVARVRRLARCCARKR